VDPDPLVVKDKSRKRTVNCFSPLRLKQQYTAASSIFSVFSLIFNLKFFLQNSKEWCFKIKVYPSLIPCSVPGVSHYEARQTVDEDQALGFFMNRGVASDLAEYFVWRHRSSSETERCIFLPRILTEPEMNEPKLLNNFQLE